MAPSTPTIRDHQLTYWEEGAARTLIVGTPEWYGWLETATAFTFSVATGGFTARRERAGNGRGGWYWKAYRKHHGRLYRAYLGKAPALTAARLAMIAARLAAKNTETLRTTPTPHPLALPVTALLSRTKLFVPAIRPDAIPRPRLLARLTVGLRGPLTLLAAPVGYGKTTILAAWHAAHGRSTPLAWVTLDAADNDPVGFCRSVATALDGVHPGVGDELLALLQALQPTVEGVLMALRTALTVLPAATVLILEDYHLITAAPIHQALTSLLEHRPPRLHLVIATRVDPPLPLARLRAQGALTELRAPDLRFTHDEAAAFLAATLSQTLAAAEVTALEARTEGWAVGLQLAALALRGQPPERRAAAIAAFGGSDRHVGDYLFEEVLVRQPRAMQEFLLRTAILDRLCGPLCDAVAPPHAGAPDGQAMLELLEVSNLFVTPLDNERRWYRYHQLFAELLRLRLTRDLPGLAADLHRRASAWCAGAGLLDAAVQHALAAPDIPLAAALIERHAPALLQRSEVLLVRAWLAQLPGDMVDDRPRLALTNAWVLALTGDFAAVDGLLRRDAGGPHALGWPPALSAEALLLEANMARIRGDLPRARALSEAALAFVAAMRVPLPGGALRADVTSSALLSRGVDQQARGDLAAAARTLDEAITLGLSGDWGRYVALVALEALVILRVGQGQLRLAVAASARSSAIAARPGEALLPVAGLIEIALGAVLGERGDLDRAENVLERGIALVRGAGEPLALARGHGALARLLHARGDAAGALATLARGTAWLAPLGTAGTAARAHLAAQQARLWLAQGQLAAAAGWAQAVMGGGADPTSFERLTLIRLSIAQGRHDPRDPALGAALAMIGRLRAAAEATGWHGRVIELLLLEALTDQALGEWEPGLAALGRALTLAAPEGYLRLFLDEGAPLATLLKQWLAGRNARDPHPPERAAQVYARGLLASMQATHLGTPARRGVPVSEALTGRELDVLRLMAEGRSNSEIAALLFVAVSGVKSYINRLFRKLAVTSRTQAVARARELGLLAA